MRYLGKFKFALIIIFTVNIIVYLIIFSYYFTQFYVILSIVRRFIWNFYRLENEHLNNCGEFRAVRDISISGQNINLSSLNRILKVMDEPDGLSIFRNKMKSRMLDEKARKKALDESMDPSVVLIM